jgi:hypothetical protein
MDALGLGGSKLAGRMGIDHDLEFRSPHTRSTRRSML